MAQQQVQVRPQKHRPAGDEDDSQQDVPTEVNEVSQEVSKRAAEWLRRNP